MDFFDLYRYGFWLQIICVIHWVRKRPEQYWLWIIIVFGPLGALAYVFAEIIPGLSVRSHRFSYFDRKRRIRDTRTAVASNPSPGNYEDLGDVLLDDRQYREAKECFDKAITPRTDAVDLYYRRALCEVELEQWPDAVRDLSIVVQREPGWDFFRAQGLLAHAYARNGQVEEARAQFERAMQVSTLNETEVYYAEFLKQTGDVAGAKEVAKRVLSRKATMPGFQKRVNRKWFRRASSIA